MTNDNLSEGMRRRQKKEKHPRLVFFSNNLIIIARTKVRRRLKNTHIDMMKAHTPIFCEGERKKEKKVTSNVVPVNAFSLCLAVLLKVVCNAHIR